MSPEKTSAKKKSSKASKSTSKKKTESKTESTPSFPKVMRTRPRTVKAQMPARMTAAGKSQLTELKKSGKLKEVKSKREKKRTRKKEQEAKFGVELDRGEDGLSISISHPTSPVSLVAPRQREQGELSLRKKTVIRAQKLREKRKRKRRKG